MVLSSILTQTRKPEHLIIFNDGDDFNPHQDPTYKPLLRALEDEHVQWVFAFGGKKGQVFNHQSALDHSTTDCIWRLDDDTIPNPNVLEELMKCLEKDNKVGAVGGLVYHPGGHPPFSGQLGAKIEDIMCGVNIQWFEHPKNKLMEVDHLYSTFVFLRKAGIQAGGYSKELSAVGHREETMFSHSIKRSGYKLLVNTNAVTWHLRNSEGGIRSFRDESLWQHDEAIFRKYLESCKCTSNKYKYIVLLGGLGDHYAFKQVYPEIKARYLDHKIIIACCYPESLIDLTEVKLITIEDARRILGNLDSYDIYKWMGDRQWKSHITDAYRAMYL
jgi:glycosyltransferase involved in cell wall biosynthesis